MNDADVVRLMKAMQSFDCTDQQVLGVVGAMSAPIQKAPRSPAAVRQANYRDRKRAAAESGDAAPDVTPTQTVTETVMGTVTSTVINEVTPPRVSASAPVLYGAESKRKNPPSETTSPQPPAGADDGKRARRLPADWKPNGAHWAEARKLRLPEKMLDEIAEEFVNYWLSEGGAKSRKLDWDRTFLNRLREQAPRKLRFQANEKQGGSISKALDQLNFGEIDVIERPGPLFAPKGARASEIAYRLLPER